ncbi:MAG: tyrosine-type recombinase/integrase [Acutalibacter sp.]
MGLPALGKLAPQDVLIANKGCFLCRKKRETCKAKSAFRRMWDKVSRRLDFVLTPHMLHHTFASICHAVGADLKTAQVWMGHPSITVITNICAHLEARSGCPRKKAAA